jgi:CRP-like cAMP-binding protein
MTERPEAAALASIRRAAHFSGLSDAEFGAVERLVSPLMVPRGALLCAPGDTVDGAFLLVSGTVTEIWPDEDIAHSSPGTLLAPGGLLSSSPTDHTLSAQSDAAVLKLTRSALEGLLMQGEPLGHAVLEQVVQLLVRRVRRLNHRLSDLLSES